MTLSRRSLFGFALVPLATKAVAKQAELERAAAYGKAAALRTNVSMRCTGLLTEAAQAELVEFDTTPIGYLKAANVHRASAFDELGKMLDSIEHQEGKDYWVLRRLNKEISMLCAEDEQKPDAM